MLRVAFRNRIRRLGTLGILLLCSGSVTCPLVRHGREAVSVVIAGRLLSAASSVEKEFHGLLVTGRS